MRDGHHGARERLAGAAPATRRSRRRGGSSARREAACPARSSSTRHSATRRRSPPDSIVTSASAGGRRSASIATSILLSRFQRSCASICSCTRACSIEQLLHRVVVHRLGERHRDLVESVEKPALRRDRLLDVAAARLGRVELAAPAAESRCACPRRPTPRPESPGRSPAMIRRSERLSRAVGAEHADLGARIEGEPDLVAG